MLLSMDTLSCEKPTTPKPPKSTIYICLSFLCIRFLKRISPFSDTTSHRKIYLALVWRRLLCLDNLNIILRTISAIRLCVCLFPNKTPSQTTDNHTRCIINSCLATSRYSFFLLAITYHPSD